MIIAEVKQISHRQREYRRNRCTISISKERVINKFPFLQKKMIKQLDKYYSLLFPSLIKMDQKLLKKVEINVPLHLSSSLHTPGYANS